MSATDDAMRWLRDTFGARIDAAIAGTPFKRNLIIAIAMQETSYIWMKVYKERSVADTLAVCVGDSIDAPRRSAFPKNRAELEARPRGKAMFKIARKALEDIAVINSGYRPAAAKPDKFCHGYGMFQYDLQFFLEDPDFFVDMKWATFEGTIAKCVKELKDKLKRVYGAGKHTLTRDESVYVAIAYNKGSANLNKDFKQGYKGDDGKYYGENIDFYLRKADRIL